VQEGELNMGVSQTKRISAVDNTIAAGGQLDIEIKSDNACNIHGLIVDLWVGQQVATFHDFGYWAVSLLPRTQTQVPNLITSQVNDERDSAVFWMLGSWMIVDTDRAHVGGAPRTSRNCPRDGRMVVSISNAALSAGSVRVHGVISWFETVK